MNQIRNRVKYDIVRVAAIQKTANVFGVGENYVRQIVRGILMNESILNYFNSAYDEIKAVVTPTENENGN